MASGRLDVIDAAYPPATSAMVASGVRRKMRYLYESGKGYTSRERDADRAYGVSVGKNMEAGAGDLRGGYSVGRAQGERALRCLQPDGHGPVILSADYDLVARADYGQVEQAIRGAMSVLGGDVKNGDGTGIYGEYDLIEAMYAVFGPTIGYWQTYAWSGGRLSTHADLYQFSNNRSFAGAQVDFNQLTGRWFGTMPSGLSTQGGGTAIPAGTSEDEEDMAKAVEVKVVAGESVLLRVPKWVTAASITCDPVDQAVRVRRVHSSSSRVDNVEAVWPASAASRGADATRIGRGVHNTFALDGDKFNALAVRHYGAADEGGEGHPVVVTLMDDA